MPANARLPPFAALRGFEAAARLGSFKRAAAELALTPSAVSHQVKTLEAHLGITLFTRTERGLQLTEAGRLYSNELSQVLELLRTATQRVQAQGADTLTLWLYPTFAARWLLPRLGSFHRAHPHLRVSVVSRPQPRLNLSEVDMLVHYGPMTQPGVQCDLLLAEQLLPVCSRNYLTQAPPLTRPMDLAHHTLIHYSDNPFEWPQWLVAAGMPGLVPHRHLELDSRTLTLQAAADGLGIAMGRIPFVDDDLHHGRLVAPFTLTVNGPHDYYLVYTEATAGLAKISVFRDWLLAACGRPVEDPRVRTDD
ncbi:MAG: transcriptional regulator GcvA [Candidatus Competibacterales bacterium]